MSFEPEVTYWIQRWALAELAEQNWAQVDIDELLDPPPARATRAILDCLALAVSLAREVDETVAGLVTIPLSVAEEQAQPPLAHPSFDMLLGQNWTYGPGNTVPDLYLLRPEAWRAYDEVEEYRIGVPMSDQPAGEHAYYRAWRSLDERQQLPREWNRAIYVRTA